MTGSEIVGLDAHSNSKYAVIISVQLLKSIIEGDVFDDNELYDLLQSAIENQSNLKAPSLKNIVLDTVFRIRKNHFFVKQEALFGKNFCDIGI